MASSNVAFADTAVMSGTMYSGVDITETVNLNVNSLNINQPGAQLTYNAPIPTSNLVSGYSESITNWNIAISPTPNGIVDLTDQFGNPYRQFTWNVTHSNGSSYVITATTTFHADITGEASPVNYNDPVGTSAMSQFLSATPLIQSNDQSIKDKAAQLVNGASGEADAVDRIMNFVKTNIPNQVLNSPQKDAVWSLTSNSGNCVNRANLALALLRSSGIPSRYVSGYVYGDNFAITYSAGVGTVNWDSGPHTWVEVYYPAEGVWVPYDPFMDKGFVDSRHVKTQVSLDDDTSSPNYRNTHGDSGLFNVINVNPEVSVSMTSTISRANLQDNNQLHQYGSTQSAPQGVLMFARSLQSIATATPTATASPTTLATPTANATVTPSPSTNASVTPSPSIAANVTVTPVPATNSSIPTPVSSPGIGDNGTYYKLSGIVVSALTEKPVQGAAILCGTDAMKTGDNGIFAFFERNGTVTLYVVADGYKSYNSTIITSGQDQNIRIELTSLPTASASGSSKTSFPIPGPTILITIAIFTGSAALLWRARDR